MTDLARRTSELSPLKQAYLALEQMQARLEAVERKQSEPIAIIGMGCRFPQGANSPDLYWQLLANGSDAITEVPASRWAVDTYYSTDADTPGKTYTRHGGFLNINLDQFDPSFFGIAPREAVSMDPQQRLLLEVTWEALESAGIAPSSLAGSRTGVFVGISTYDYNLLRNSDSTLIDAYFGTGNTFSVAAGRLSYLLGLQGPNFPIDTACSSSLVAIHLACQSLHMGESNLALVGGVNLLLSPEPTIFFSKVRALSPDGHCKTFDADANGYVRGEGCGMIVLKRLSEAQADRDNIFAVIYGSAINHDGHSSGLTVPNVAAQQAVIREALVAARLKPEQISYIEAHGTGTPLGDPIEIRALTAIHENRRQQNPLYVGSVKTNIGHTEAAAGIASLIKVVLSLQHKSIPAHLHFKRLNPYISFANTPIVIPTRTISWDSRGSRYAGISAFAFSGTNAHLVIGEAPAIDPPAAISDRSYHVLALSAKSDQALKALSNEISSALPQESTLADITYSLNTGRNHFSHRIALVTNDKQQFQESLRNLAQSEQITDSTKSSPRIAFLFSGQGVQYVGMGRQLYETSAVFRQALQQCDQLLQPHLDRSLVDLIYQGDDSTLQQTLYTQPVLFAIEYALAELWRSWGITPQAVLGHSIGEYVAAVYAGVFDLADALYLVAQRGRLMHELAVDGAMAAVFAEEALVQESLAPFADRVAIAAINAPRNIVISGTASAVAEVIQKLQDKGIKTRNLNVSQAFHSPLMDNILLPFEQAVRAVKRKPLTLTLISNVTGQPANPNEIIEPSYWRNHLRKPVQFARGINSLYQQEITVFIEIGPRPTLLTLAQQCLPDTPSERYLPSLRPDTDDWRQMLESLAQVYQMGANVDWRAFDAAYPRQRVALPTYPFQRSRYWLPFDKTIDQVKGGQSVSENIDIPGRRVSTPLDKTIFEGTLGAESALKDHRVYDQTVVPAVIFFLAAWGAAQKVNREPTTLENFLIQEALLLNTDTPLQTIVSSAPDGLSIEVFSHDEDMDQWVLHASGHSRSLVESRPPAIALESILVGCPDLMDGATFYESMANRAIALGPSFQKIEKLWRGEGQAVAQLRTSHSGDSLHPLLLDAAFQMAGGLSRYNLDENATIYLPISVSRLTIWQPASEPRWCYARLNHESDTGQFTVDLWLLDSAAAVIASIQELTFKRADRKSLLRQLNPTYWLYELAWQRESPEAQSAVPLLSAREKWLIVGDNQEMGQAFGFLLEQAGQQAQVINAHDQANLLQALNPSADLNQIVYLSEVSQESLTAATICGALLSLLQTLLRNPAQAKLWIVTRGAQAAIPNTVIYPEQAALWGMGRVIGLEHPEYFGGLIDLDPAISVGEAAQQLLTLFSSPLEPQIAYYDNKRYLARLASIPMVTTIPAFQLSAESTYLVTGGLGGIGQVLCDWLIAHGARYLALINRSTPDEHSAAWLDSWAQQGISITPLCADVADIDQVYAVFEHISASMPALAGVLHLAGTLDDGLLFQQNQSRFEKVMRPKVQGAWNLHTLTQDIPLTFFVMFSSASALLGSPGQSNYAAANAYMDALAHYRHQNGLPALSVNWGPWHHTGMTAGRPVSDTRGIGLLDPQLALSHLEQLLQMPSQRAQVAVLSVDWSVISDSLGNAPLFSLVIEKRKQPRSKPQVSKLFDELANVDIPTRTERLADLITTLVRKVMGLDLAQPVDPQLGFFEIGMDSLMAIELKNQLQTSLGKSLPATIGFDYPSIQGLSTYLSSDLFADLPDKVASQDTQSTRAEERSELIEEISHLSEDELDVLLSQFADEHLKNKKEEN